MPQKRKQEIADRLRDIFYAPDRVRARELYAQFYTDYEREFLSGVTSLKNSIERCLTFYFFPEEEWIGLRTTNAIERVNKEFKRRTNPMEVLAGERLSLHDPELHRAENRTVLEIRAASEKKPPRPPEVYIKFLTLPQFAFDAVSHAE